MEELKKEIQETRSVVKFMRAKLNEVNLLNAKLLFSNKLFRAFGLNNNQKLKVVEIKMHNAYINKANNFIVFTIKQTYANAFSL